MVRTFSPPANLKDFDEQLRAIWHNQMNSWFEATIRNVEAGNDYFGPGVGLGNSQFYNPTKLEPQDEIALPIIWTGFPRTLLTLHGREKALLIAEKLVTFGQPDGSVPGDVGHGVTSAFLDPDGNDLHVKFRLQDEYLEWRTELDPVTGKVIRVTFTCEGPEYWLTLARYDRAKLIELYRHFVDPDVQWADLSFQTDAANRDGSYQAGTYNPWNKWNTTHGIMHLSHWANTLTAEIDLAGAGTILRPGIGTPYLAESARLICCSAYGGPNRSSDPQIGSNVNKLAQLGAFVSLQIPVALYIDQYDKNVATDASGNPVPNFWRILRGEEGVAGDPERPSRILRMEYSVPRDKYGYVVGDLLIDGEPIQYGGQLAAHVHMKLTGVAHGFGKGKRIVRDCLRRAWRLKKNHDYLDAFIYPPAANGGKASEYEPAFPDDAGFASSRQGPAQEMKTALTQVTESHLRRARRRL